MNKIDPALYNFMKEVPADQRNDVLNALAAEFWTSAPWGNIQPAVADVRQSNGGTGVAMYYRDPETQQILIPMVVPVRLVDGSDNPTGIEEKYQIPGGHIDFAGQETLLQACIRETGEEAAGPQGAILSGLEESQFIHLDHLLIYPRGFPIYVDGFGLELSEAQFKAMSSYHEEQIDITGFTKDNEIRAIRVLSLPEILQNPDRLNHQDQISLFNKLKDHVAPKPAGMQQNLV